MISDTTKVEYAAALSPGTPIYFYSDNQASPAIDPSVNPSTSEPYQDLLTYLLGLPSDSTPDVLVIPYSENEQDIPSDYMDAVCDQFQQLGAKGTSVIVAAGDTGVGGNCLWRSVQLGYRLTSFVVVVPHDNIGMGQRDST
jgi:tripeptidyl-peptidase I